MLLPGDPAPQFSSVDVINGHTYNLADCAGKVVLLSFSGPSWCAPCQFEAPVLQDLWHVFSHSFEKPRVQFLMISCGETSQAFKHAVQYFGLTFPALLDPGEKIKSLYEVGGVPFLYVINTEQKICDIHFGPSPPASAVYEHLYGLLIGCGAAEPKELRLDLWPWPYRIPIPDPDPWQRLPRLSADRRDVLFQLAMAEMAKGVSDFETSRALQELALKGAQDTINKIVAKHAHQPKELHETFLELPKKRAR